jgi:hypothetical protein
MVGLYYSASTLAGRASDPFVVTPCTYLINCVPGTSQTTSISAPFLSTALPFLVGCWQREASSALRAVIGYSCAPFSDSFRAVISIMYSRVLSLSLHLQCFIFFVSPQALSLVLTFCIHSQCLVLLVSLPASSTSLLHITSKKHHPILV